MKLNTEIEGLRCLFEGKEYKAMILKRLWQIQVFDGEDIIGRGSQTSREMFNWLDRHNVEARGRSKGGISRTSVINGLNELVEIGFVDYVEKLGKGGYAKHYRASTSPYVFKNMVLSQLSGKLAEVFKNNFWEVNQ